MAQTYTYDQFESALNSSGLAGQFSQADLALARSNPSAGMSILNSKIRWNNAGSDEERWAANQAAERVRSSYGEYTGGSAGSLYQLNDLSPSFYQRSETPMYSNSYADMQNATLGQLNNYGTYSYGKDAPTYNNRYQGRIDDALNRLTDTPQFSFNLEENDLYPIYRKEYTREGNRAAADALGTAAAATGGIPSSYAQTATAQARNYYAAQMTDKIPELYQIAYQKYLDDYSRGQANLNAIMNVEQNDYNKYLTQLNQYNTDRSFDYNAWVDRYNMLSNNLDQQTKLQQNEYQQYLNDVAQSNWENTFDYNQLVDEYNSQQADKQMAWNNAQTAANYGDYSWLQKQGVNVSQAEWEQALANAQARAAYGDYSGLEALGLVLPGNGYTDGYTGGGSGGGGRAPTLPITEDTLAQLKAAYPNGITNKAKWDEIVNVFGSEYNANYFGLYYTEPSVSQLNISTPAPQQKASAGSSSGTSSYPKNSYKTRMTK